MIRTVVSIITNTNGAFSYSELLNMELSEFDDVLMELKIKDSADRINQMRIDNHARAVAGKL